MSHVTYERTQSKSTSADCTTGWSLCSDSGVRVCVRVCAHVCVCACVQTCVCVCVCTCMWTCKFVVDSGMCAYVGGCMSKYVSGLGVSVRNK